ncbi:hypothetical protein F4778DRAFT_785365 [Xylariomycetidae sp. FL2044]|nr:hypothetical protein F4778DRAFT_785365 [Xylariomycetidae sp. FL2044]
MRYSLATIAFLLGTSGVSAAAVSNSDQEQGKRDVRNVNPYSQHDLDKEKRDREKHEDLKYKKKRDEEEAKAEEPVNFAYDYTDLPDPEDPVEEGITIEISVDPAATKTDNIELSFEPTLTLTDVSAKISIPPTATVLPTIHMSVPPDASVA